MAITEKTIINEATSEFITTSASNTKSITSNLSSSAPSLSPEIFTVIETVSVPLTPSAEPSITSDQPYFSSNDKNIAIVCGGIFLLAVFGIIIYKAQRWFKKRRRNAMAMAEEGIFISPTTITPTSPRYEQREADREHIRRSDNQRLRNRKASEPFLSAIQE